jgi:hypothetical protein
MNPAPIILQAASELPTHTSAIKTVIQLYLSTMPHAVTSQRIVTTLHQHVSLWCQLSVAMHHHLVPHRVQQTRAKDKSPCNNNMCILGCKSSQMPAVHNLLCSHQYCGEKLHLWLLHSLAFDTTTLTWTQDRNIFLIHHLEHWGGGVLLIVHKAEYFLYRNCPKN